MTYVPPRDPTGKYTNRPGARPAPCQGCGGPSVWNGWRRISEESRRHRVKCKLCGHTWTEYEDGGYPHRLFALAVVFSCVASILIGGASRVDAARDHGCSRRSASRWVKWVEGLAEPRDLARLCTRLDPDGVTAHWSSAEEHRGRSVFGLLERLAELLAVKGVLQDAPDRPGFVRLLLDRHRRFGEVFYLTRPSPPLPAAWEGLIG